MTEAEAITRGWIATCYRDQGHLVEALAHLKRTVELFRITQSPNLKTAEATLAQVERIYTRRLDFALNGSR